MVCFLGIGLFALWSSSTAKKHDIQALLERRAQALQQKDLAQYLSCFSSDYQSGDRRYDDLKADASQWFTQFDSIQFLFQTRDLQLRNTSAIVENEYAFSLTDTAGETIKIAKRELLEIRREHEEWKISKALSLP